ncbi:MAG: hypothetical protein HKN41_07395 [Ilumatobacter sp.]|nr:hypothetical protein [Ilumatobacter sp.]
MDESAAAADTEAASIERRLDELQRESQERRRELLALAAELPEVTSRRALVRSMASSIVHAPNKPLVAKRVVLKVLRQPIELWHRFR